MLVIKYPDPFALKQFKLSKYSRMLGNKEARRLYRPLNLIKEVQHINTARKKALQVITKDVKLKNDLAKLYNMTSFPDTELEHRLKAEEEIFNYKPDYDYPKDIQVVIENDIR